MTSARFDVLMWARRVAARKGSAPHVLLEVKPDASMQDAQDAFHKVARMAHPDLHRNALTPEELELVTNAYAVVAGAYQSFRSQSMVTTRMRPMKEADLMAAAIARGSTPAKGVPAPAATRPPPSAPADGPTPTAGNAAAQMSSRALVYYRKAELALRRGDLRGAVLQLKMAIATDPQSGFLRTALAEVELELRKGP